MQYSVVLPAYNEERHISQNLNVLLSIPEIDEIIVVNDGSTDNTKQIVGEFELIKVIHNKQNLGKTASVCQGVEAATSPNIILYDADLQNMKQEYVQKMIIKYEQGCDMVIMNKNAAPWIFRHGVKTLPALSGTRVLGKKHLLKIAAGGIKSWCLETRINDYFLSHNLKIGFTEAPDVYDPRKYIKYNFFEGSILDIKAASEVLLSFGVAGIPKNFQIMDAIYNLYEQSRTNLKPQ